MPVALLVELVVVPLVLDVLDVLLEVLAAVLLLAGELVLALELLELAPPPHAASRTAPPTSPSARSPLPKPMDMESTHPFSTVDA